LVTHPDFRDIPKIVLTGFASLRHMRAALLVDDEGRPGALDFIEKRQPPEEMVEIVERVARQRLRINHALRVHSDPRALLNLSNLAGLLAPAAQARGAGEQSPEDYAGELEDLVRRVFYDFEQITLKKMLWLHDKRLALIVLAYAPAGQDAKDCAFVVTCGAAEALRAEAELYRRHAPAALAPDLQAALKTATTVHFGINAYDIANGELETARTLGEFFSDASARQFGDILESLYRVTLAPWHAVTRVQAPAPLAVLVQDSLPYSLKDASVQLRVSLLAIASQAHAHALADVNIMDDAMQFSFAKLKQETLPNPAHCLETRALTSSERSVRYSTLIRSLGGDTVLVSPPSRAWVADYASLGPGPLVADYAAVEVAIKYDLTDCSDPLERYEMERELIALRQLDARFEPSVPAVLDKTVSAVRRLRKLAAEACGSDAAPYCAALFAATTNRLLHLDPSIHYTRKETAAVLHAALSLGLICQRMMVSESGVSGPRELRLLPGERQVVVSGIPVALTPHEYDLMRFLWENQGDVCPRAAVERAVFGDVLLKTDSARLNVLVNRLRSKIEPDPDDPIYLVTIRGHGFRLFPHGRPTAPKP
jgi:hypothetical protein